jgi:TolA-binding protein
MLSRLHYLTRRLCWFIVLSAFVWTGCTASTVSKKAPATHQQPATPKQPTTKSRTKVAPSTRPAAKPVPSTKPGAKSAPQPTAPASVNAKAQQELYDLGLQHYMEERYAEAKTAWRQVIKLGPNTTLAARARENIGKADRILQTLEELRTR